MRRSLSLFGIHSALGAALLAAACGPAPATPPAAPTSAPAKPVEQKPAAVSSSPSPGASPAASLVPSPGAAAKSATATGAPGVPTIAPFNEAAVAEFYRGKTVRWIVGFGAGGGYDTYTRLVAKYLGKHLPGNPTVIVENLPGGGSAVAFTQVYSSLPKDGTIVGHGDGTLALQQVLGNQTLEWDSTKWQYVGAPSVYEYLYVVSKSGLDRAGISAPADHLPPARKQLIVGVSGVGVSQTAARLMRDVLGANIKMVDGYAGTAQQRLAMENGEIDGIFTSWDSVKTTHPEEVKNGSHVLLVQFPEKQIAGLPYNVASAWDMAKTDDERQLLRYGALATHQFARPYVMAPGVPADRVAAMQSAFMKSMADPELLADAQKAQLDINPIAGPELGKIVTDFMEMPEGVKGKLKEVLSRPLN